MSDLEKRSDTNPDINLDDLEEVKIAKKPKGMGIIMPEGAGPPPPPPIPDFQPESISLDGDFLNGDEPLEETVLEDPFGEPYEDLGESTPTEAPHLPLAEDPLAFLDEPPAEEPPPFDPTPEPTGHDFEPGFDLAQEPEADDTFEHEPQTDVSFEQTVPLVEAPPEPVKRPELDLIPLRAGPPADENSWLFNYNAFNRESQNLAKIGNWRKLAGIAGYAIMHAPYATGTTSAAMLLMLATVYRDRIKDQTRAEQAFAALAQVNPASSDALSYLGELYLQREEWGKIYALYLEAVKATWVPHERLDWTQRADRIAIEKLGQIDLAIDAWERLWHLGDGLEEASRALMRYYHQTGRWSELSTFLQERADRLEGPAKRVVLRELAEVKLSGLQDPAAASGVLEQLVVQQPNDPIAVLQLARVYTRQANYDALATLGRETFTAVSPIAAVADIQRLVADSLWRNDKLGLAVEAYDRLLEVDPGATYGIARKREYLTREERHQELLEALIALGEATLDDDEKISIFAEAAQLADEKLQAPSRAIELWERVTTIREHHLPPYEALTRLHDSVANLDGVASALSARIKLTRDREQRIELLQQLGSHYSERMGDDESAEKCWKEILSLDPSHMPVRGELIKLHRRRGDFESLNSSLMRQIALTTDDERAEALCRMAAENLDQNFNDSERSAEAWRRVIDFARMDVGALEALAAHYSVLERRRDLIAVLEQQVRASSEIDVRIGLLLQIAELWEKEEKPGAAVAAFERILRWDPVNELAITALVRLYSVANLKSRGRGVLENAAALIPEPANRVPLVSRCLELLPEDDHRARFYLRRRLLHLGGSDPQVLEDLYLEAEKDPSLHPELASVLLQLASQAADPADRRQLFSRLARLYETKLEDNHRAYLAQQATHLLPIDPEALEELQRLARQSSRHEDLLAALDRMTTPEFELEQRKARVRQRAEICEKELEDPVRAFEEYRRLLLLDPADWAPLTDLERLAGSSNLWLQYDHLLCELWDRTSERDGHLDLLSRRDKVAREQLQDASGAFERLVERFRLDSSNQELEAALGRDADALEQWLALIPLLEAARMALGEDATADDIAGVAGLYSEKLDDNEMAFALTTRAFVKEPTRDDLRDKLTGLAETIGAYDRLADTFRSAVAGHQDHEHTIDMLRRIASIYEEKLDSPTRAIDIHRKMLHIKDDELRSLEVMIEWHRSKNHMRDLRDRLYQWIFLTEDQQPRVDKLKEITEISNKLGEADGALGAYGMMLELDPENSDAREGLRTLEQEMTEPEPRLKWLDMRLKTTTDESDIIELRLEMARILEEDLRDPDDAINALEGLLESTGPNGPGFDPLARLLRERGRWSRLVELLQQRAKAQKKKKQKKKTLEEALAICATKLENSEPELHHELYRFVLKVQPDNNEVRVLLARLLRSDGQYEELVELLEENLTFLSGPAKLDTMFELSRLNAQNLGKKEEAAEYLNDILEQDPKQEGALLAQARDAYVHEDYPLYIELRQKQVELSGSAEGAHILCHLAEIADEVPALASKRTPFYRKARALDPNNEPAREALKGIGRRLKDLRPQAALLPEEGERHMSLEDRSWRLRELGDSASGDNLPRAIDWYRRAVAINPYDPANWAALGKAFGRIGEHEQAYRAYRCMQSAVECTSPQDAMLLQEDSDRLYNQALAARAAGLSDDYRRLIQRAYDQVPNHAQSTLAVAQALFTEGDVQTANTLLHNTLSHHRDDLSTDQLVMALYNRGMTLRDLERPEEALEDFRTALELQPLHTDCLIAIGELLAARGRIAAALEHQIRALTVVIDPMERARLHHRIGVILEDDLNSVEEAGAHYETALAKGLEDRDLIHRALRHFQRSGQVERTMEMLESLLPIADDPDELATLWLMRGELFANQEGQEIEALEAFDMALSYDPNHQAARAGLINILERKGDWEQLTQVLEAAADQGPPPQRADALRSLANICIEKMDDYRRAADYLFRAVRIFATSEAVNQLNDVMQLLHNPSEEERTEVLAMLIRFGPPIFEHAVELSTLVVADSPAWAWCLLSPLGAVSRLDKELKMVVQDLKSDFSSAPLLCPAVNDYPKLAHQTLRIPLAGVLADLDERISLGYTSIDQLDDSASEMGENTSPGRIFNAMAQAVDLVDASLYRAKSLDDVVALVNTEGGPAILVRNDVMNKLVKNEAAFIFAYALCLAQPGYRIFAAMPADERSRLLPALWSLLEFKESTDPAVLELAERIGEIMDPESLEMWKEELVDSRNDDPLELGAVWWEAIRTTCRRAGFLACGSLQMAFRVIAKFDEDVPKLKVQPTIEKLDEFIETSDVLKDFVGFAATREFGEVLLNSTPFADV